MMANIAVIGSFRHARYGRVVEIIRTFRAAGFDIVSPSGAEIVKGDQFVRFATDDCSLSDAEIQTKTLENIFRADLVYVVAPGGYVGKTTCYEIGRVVQRRQPIFFSEPPDDLPVHIPDWCVVSPEDFMLRFLGSTSFDWLFSRDSGELFDAERRLAAP